MNKRKELSFKASLGGIVSALSLVLMIISGITISLEYAIPMITGALLMVLVVEFSKGFATVVYIAVSVLSLLILGNKEPAIMYLMFFGYYPIIKSILEGHLKKIFCRIVKYLVFNASMIASYFVVTRIFMIPFDDMDSFGKFGILLLLLAGNIIFPLYDVLLTRLVSVYIYKWQKHIKRVFK